MQKIKETKNKINDLKTSLEFTQKKISKKKLLTLSKSLWV